MLHGDIEHQVLSVGASNMPPNKSMMADGHHLEKSSNRNISAME